MVSGLTTALVGSAIKWGGTLLAKARSRLPDDHTALLRGGAGINAVSSFQGLIPIFVACAPSRHLRKSGFDPDLANEIVEAQFLGMYPDGPDFSTPVQGSRYQVNTDDQLHYMLRRTWICPDGRVDLYITVDPTPLEGATEVGLPILEVLRPLLLLLFLIQSGNYDRLFKRPRHCLRRRFDWFFAVSGDVQMTDSQRAFWIPQFPGRSARRPVSQPSFCPSEGFGFRELRGWSTRKSWEDFSRIALRSLLQYNGYHDNDGAIDDVIIEAGKKLVPELRQQTRPPNT